jgi:hypothetical protein
MMNLREGAWLFCRALTGVLSMVVSMHGFYSLWAVDLRFNTLWAVLYCAIPACSFLVFLFVRSQRMQVALQAVVALGYLGVYSMLSWRTCAALGYCESVGAVVLRIMVTRPVEAAIAVVLLTALTGWVDGEGNRTSQA